MGQVPTAICYSTGEAALVGDQVNCDGRRAVVVDVIETLQQMAAWGLTEPGIMLECNELGLVYQPASSLAWEAIVLEVRTI